ncbi:MAG: hypothetical protein EBR82_46300 [Caulobacteraceae bacterium]|nr:hypothetical protein [Caulobacteraceae bacterium]
MRTLILGFDNDLLQPFDEQNAVQLPVTLATSTYFQKGAFVELVPGGTANQIRPVPSGVVGTPIGLFIRNAITDSAGNITLGTPAAGNEQFATIQSATVMTSGHFKTSDLVQTGAGAINSAYVTPGNRNAIGRLVTGTTANGTIKLN